MDVVPLPVIKNPKFTSATGSYPLGSGVRGALAGLLRVTRSCLCIKRFPTGGNAFSVNGIGQNLSESHS